MPKHPGVANAALHAMIVICLAVTTEGCGAKSDTWERESLSPVEDGSTDVDVVEDVDEEAVP